MNTSNGLQRIRENRAGDRENTNPQHHSGSDSEVAEIQTSGSCESLNRSKAASLWRDIIILA
jgi:hypothetical protein